MTRSPDSVQTWLYVPADRPDRLDKALRSGADAVIADLEDGVAPAAKGAARTSLTDWLRAVRQDGEGPAIWLRVDSVALDEDVAVAASAAVAGVCRPKVGSPGNVAAFQLRLAALEKDSGRPPLALMLMVETARAVVDCTAIAAAAAATGRPAVLQLGEQDLRADLALPPGDATLPAPGPLQSARDTVVLASAAAGLIPPIAPVSTAIHDAERLLAETAELRAAGFGSRAVIHPAQLEPVRRGLAPSDAEVEWAAQVVAAAEEAEDGVTVVAGGMVDAPVVAQARDILRRSDQHG